MYSSQTQLDAVARVAISQRHETHAEVMSMQHPTALRFALKLTAHGLQESWLLFYCIFSRLLPGHVIVYALDNRI